MAAAAEMTEETTASRIETLRSEARMTHLLVLAPKKRCTNLAVAAEATREVVATKAVVAAVTEIAPIAMKVAVVAVATVTVVATEVVLLQVADTEAVVLRSPLLLRVVLANSYLTISDSKPWPKTTSFTSTI